jgi:hypothetical protein
MNTILIGTFVARVCEAVVLTQQTKLTVMEKIITGSVSASERIHSDLIEACKNGDQKAQFMIYKLYYKSMYNISLSILNDPVEAEDIMQESFFSAFEQLDSFKGTVNFGAWLKKIIWNRSIDCWRKKGRTRFEDIEFFSSL